MGTILRQVIRERGMTQYRCAAVLGMKSQQVSYLCKAKRWQMGTVERICRALHVPVDVFFRSGS